MRKPHSDQSSSTSSRAGDDQDYLQLLKAVAQAWHAQADNPKPISEFDAQQSHSSFRSGPTRFKTEAMNNMKNFNSLVPNFTCTWDFSESLLDSYEIVTLSKRLEASLVVDPTAIPGGGRTGKRAPGESRNSLRSLFHTASSNRF